MQQHDIVQTVLLATYFPRQGTGISNYRLRYWLQARPEFTMFGSLDFEHFFYQGLNELEELATQGSIKGIKIYTAYQQIDLHGADFRRVAQLASDTGLPLMFHGGVSYNTWQALGGMQHVLALADVPPDDMPPIARDDHKRPRDFEAVAQAFPKVNVIVSHLCKPFFTEMIAVLQRNANLFTDMSGILDSKLDAANRDQCVAQVRRFATECGPEKLLFGTDFPVQTHADSVYVVEAALKDFSTHARKQVYFANANRIIFGSRLHQM
jgi:predicted TIM-barrel fold metal-dependent hydrolase